MQHQLEEVEPIDPIKLVIDGSLGKYRGDPGFFDAFLPKLLEIIQQQKKDDETNQRAPATVAAALAPLPPSSLAIPLPEPPPDTVSEPLAQPGWN